MTATYTFHAPPDSEPGDPDALDRAVLVRDGFSMGAFVAPALWFFLHRHVVLGLVAALAVAGLAVGLVLAGARPGTVVLCEVLLHLLFGLEAASLRRVALAWRGRPVTDLVLAADEAEASAKVIGRWLADGRTEWQPAAARPAPASTAPAYRYGAEPVIGLFPERESRR